MALTIGTPVAGSTTLAAFVDLMYGNKTAALTGASAVFTPLEPNRVVVSWPGYNDVLYMTWASRPSAPDFIFYS